jgi:hypothetical protein
VVGPDGAGGGGGGGGARRAAAGADRELGGPRPPRLPVKAAVLTTMHLRERVGALRRAPRQAMFLHLWGVL